jgi:hypothetical protein
MLIAPAHATLLRGVPNPTPFYSATRILNTDFPKSLGPSAAYFSGLNKTVVAWWMVGDGSSKGVQIAAYDHTAKTWSERYKVGNFAIADDDHGGPSVTQDSSGFFWVFYGSHATTQPLAVSTAANDISAWTQLAPLANAQTYPHASFVGTQLFVFFRNDANLSRRTLALRTATPSAGSATFSSLSEIVDWDADSRSYLGNTITVSTKIHMIATRANAADTARKGVYYFVYNTATGALENHDNSVSTASGSLPISLATANASYRIFDHGTGAGDIPVFTIDSAGDPHVIFPDNGGSGTVYNLKHMKRTSGTWSSPVTVDGLSNLGTGVGSVTTYTLVAGAAGTVEAWYPNAAGDRLRKIRSVDGNWDSAKTIRTVVANKLIGGQAVVNAASDLRTVYCDVSASTDDIDAVVCNRYAHGDLGPIVAAVPMTASDANYSSVSVLYGFESRDASTRPINEADSCILTTVNGNAQIDTAQSKFGSASLLLDGTGDYLTLPNNALFSVSQGDFTVECWVRRNELARLQNIASKRPAAGATEWTFHVNASNQLAVQAFNTSTVLALASTTTLASTSAWVHVAFSRQSTTWRLFIAGVLEASGTESGSPASNTQLLHIGRDPTTTARDWNGWIDEFRFTSGVARYTATFTPPAAAFPRR